MTRIFMSGFESGGLEEWTTVTGTNVSEEKRSGSRAGKVAAYNKQFSRDLGANYTELYLGFAFYWTNTWGTNYSQIHMVLNSSAAIQFSMHIWPMTAALQFRRGNNAGVMFASGGICHPNRWHYIECYYKIANSGGRIITKLDGVQVINYTGDTSATGTADARHLRFGSSGSASNEGATGYIDDIVVNDLTGGVNNSWPGRVGIFPALPASAGNYSELTPSAGDNFECVNEVPASDADYVSSDVLDVKDTYTPTVLAIAAGTINAVQWLARAKTSATTANLARLLRRVSDDPGSDIVLTTSYAKLCEILELDPIAAGAWTIANLNATEWGSIVR